MIRTLGVLPAFAATRALADGTSGTLGAQSVGAYELRQGGVQLDRLSPMTGPGLIGRPASSSGTGAPQTLGASEIRALADEDAPAPVFASLAEAQSRRVPPSADRIILAGRFSPRDRGGATYVAVNSEPKHQGKLQTADGRWWKIDEHHPTPLMFGARWNNVSDDTAAINDWARYLRSSGRDGFMPNGTAYCADTIYLGGCTMRGSGKILGSGLATTGTLLRCAGNPGVSHSSGLFANSNGTTAWSDFSIFAAAPDGSGVDPIELWDDPAYTHQIGVWLGRSHGLMQTISEGETPTSGGVGVITMRDISIEYFSGWSIYAYKLWGMSILEGLTFRESGHVAADAYGDDEKGGVITLSSGTVDTRILNCHAYAGPGGNAGCGLRTGGDRITTTALDRVFQTVNNIAVTGLHLESYRRPLHIHGGNIFIDKLSVEGGSGDNNARIVIGNGANPRLGTRVLFGSWRPGRTRAIEIEQGSLVDLGKIMIPDLSDELTVRYFTGFRANFLGAGDVDTTGIFQPPVRLEPMNDINQQIHGAGGHSRWSFLPFAAADIQPSTIDSNRVEAYANSAGGTLANGWSHNGVGVATVETPWSVDMRGGANDSESRLRFALSNLTPGAVHTVHLWFRFDSAPNALQNAIFGVRIPGGAILFERELGQGAFDGPGLRTMRSFNFTAPAGGAAQLYVATTGIGSPMHVEHPIVVEGLCPIPGLPRLSIWPTPSKVVTTG